MLPESDVHEHFLLAGGIFVSAEPYRVTTVLGSCVSVCLWDEALRQGGINHYMLPFWNGEGLASPKYGNIAIAKLIERMLARGSDRRDLCAKVFGGGVVLRVANPFMNIGDRNVQLAADLLRSEQVPIISADTGGNVGRKLIFNTRTGAVLVKRLRHQIEDITI
jgi:chemotaxis protein CheD